MYLLDTNTVIYFLEGSLSASAMQSLGNIVNQQSNISVITKMEALGFNFKSPSEETAMETFIEGSNVLNIDASVVAKTIVIRKATKIKLPDAILAATALSQSLILVTSNIQDYKNVSGLTTVDPRTL